MEIEDLLNAGHCVEPFKGIQVCALVCGMKRVMVESKTAAEPLVMLFVLILSS